MAENVNQNVFTDKTFITLDTLSYFWGKTKSHVDGLVNPISTDVGALKTTVGNSTTGLVKEVADIRVELEGLNGGAGSIATQISNAITALDLPNTYETKGEAAKAETAAKAYADGLAGNYDAAGSASAAEAAAKAYADGLAGNYDAAGTAEGFNTAMDARVVKLEAIDHDKLAADASATAVATILDEAPESFDTLKEVAAWIASNDHATDVATLMTDVENLKKIDHDAYVEADKTALADAKAYADGLAGNYDAAGAAATAKSEAIADAEGKYQPKGNYENAGAAAQALADAKADAATLYQPKGNYETAGTADAAIAALKLSESYDAKGSAAEAEAAAIAQAKVDAAEALKAYYTKTEVDNLLSTNSSGDRAYAKQYTDELFNSFVFAQNSDIDAIFTVSA